MSIDIKSLQKLINLCRKTGVLEIETDGLRLKLGDLPTKFKRSAKETSNQEISEKPYSEEDTLFWSSAGVN